MADQSTDIFIIGGGINGCGIARDATGRGYSVFLAEMNDLASGTSSWSTKLIHGGLRYLEHFEFSLVHESLKEREILWNIAPHIIHPRRFVLPYHQGLRPAWLLRTGLFLYDYIGGRKLLPATKSINLRVNPIGNPLIDDFKKGFEYSDCSVDDARLVILNAKDAANRGANILTQTKVIKVEENGDKWLITCVSKENNEIIRIVAKLIVNATGPWVDSVLQGTFGKNDTNNVRLVKGSHIVVSKLYDHDRCFIFQNADGRIIFTIPYQSNYTLIGTTDEEYSGDPADAKICDDEIEYLCTILSQYLKRPVTRETIVWKFSGVRPLFNDSNGAVQKASRDYEIKIDFGSNNAPVINIFGGKVTTYRKLAEIVIDKISAEIGKKDKPWTQFSKLPGGDFSVNDFESELEKFCSAHTFLKPEDATRLFSSYGKEAYQMLDGAKSETDLGTNFGFGLTETEVNWLINNEFARTQQDILWRRSKLGLSFLPDQIKKLEEFLSF